MKSVGILMYHSVGADVDLKLDLSIDKFISHMKYLSEHCNLITIDEYVRNIKCPKYYSDDTYVITFDDGFKTFIDNAMPVLERYRVPATIYVSTGFVCGDNVHPLSTNYSTFKSLLPPMSVADLINLSSNELITLGAHSHFHRDYPGLSNEQISFDIDKLLKCFSIYLGDMPRHFAYPRGRWSVRVESILKRSFESLALASGCASGMNDLSFLNKHRLQRIPVYGNDSFENFKSKLNRHNDLKQIIISYRNRNYLDIN